jgi:hypothetical protein
MNNVERLGCGNNYNLRKILLADGLGAVVGSMLGSPFPPAVYIRHPGWKSVGGRIGTRWPRHRDRAGASSASCAAAGAGAAGRSLPICSTSAW